MTFGGFGNITAGRLHSEDVEKVASAHRAPGRAMHAGDGEMEVLL
jgi:hypothetical protein